MFDMRASGQHTDKEIVDRVNAMGYRTKKNNVWDKNHQKTIGQTGGDIMTTKRLQHLIKKPIYCGVVVEKWTKNLPIKAPYAGFSFY